MRAWILVLAAGCSGGFGGGDNDREVVQNRGLMCLHALDPDLPTLTSHQSFVAGQPVFVRVDAGLCLSSSCTEELVAVCGIAGGAAGFRVTSEVSWLDTSDGGPCTADCGNTAAICETAASLGEGTFTFEFGSQTFSLTIPSEFDEPPCIGAQL